MSDDAKPDDRKARGGQARAERLTKEQRSEIARMGGLAKKAQAADTKLPDATHKGALKIGELVIPCFVLEDGRRVISGRGMTAAIGMKGRGQGIARISTLKVLNSFENNNLALAIKSPIQFLGGSPKVGVPSDGFEATVLQDLCETLLQARDAGLLKTESERRYVQYADMLIRSFARVGIIALVDEATGFQYVRDRDALQKVLETFLRKELAVWVKTFPDDFYQEMYRLRGWAWRGMQVNRISACAGYTRDLVFDRLAPKLLEELDKLNPMLGSGRRKDKHWQWLSDEVGNPALRAHLHTLVNFMRAYDDWDEFYLRLNRALPRRGQSLLLPLNEPNDLSSVRRRLSSQSPNAPQE